MRIRLKNPFRRQVPSALLLAIMAVAGLSHAQRIDLNANGMSDIWELVYGAGSLSANDDADSDGVSNGLESLAGTNPFDANSAPGITAVVHATTNFSLSLPCVLGKQYQLQSAPALSPASLTNWVTEASVVARTGAVVTVAAPASAAPKFFRIAISDVDTDGDGVNDAEEYKLGLDPAKAASNNQLDGNGQPMNDYAYAVSKLASQNVVTIAATDPTATQPDPGQSAANLGTFTVTREKASVNEIVIFPCRQRNRYLNWGHGSEAAPPVSWRDLSRHEPGRPAGTHLHRWGCCNGGEKPALLHPPTNFS